MTLDAYIRPLDLAAVRHHSGAFLQLLGGVLLVPAVAAVAFREWREVALLAGTASVAAGIGQLARRGPAPPLQLREAMALAAVSYLVAAIGGAVAFLGVAAPVDALFESMSGFTTTGLTVMDVDELPQSLLVLRAVSQWIGGGGIIVLSLVVLAGPGSAAVRLYAAESGGDNLRGSVAATGRAVAGVYVGLTVLGYVSLLAAGAGGFDGLLHALALLSTGGFSPYGASIGAYGSSAIAAVTTVFMVAGAVSFPLYYLAWERGWRRLLRDAQVLALVAIGVVGTASLLAFGGRRPAFLDAAFHATSALTTTGFVLGDPDGWSDGSRLVVIALMVVGGSVGSTAGGLKLLRLLILLRLVGWVTTRVMLPREAKIPLKVQGEPVGDDEVRRTFALATAYAVVLFLAAVTLTAAGATFPDALFDSASALGTVGLSVGAVSGDLEGWGKLAVAAVMWAGRVEILALIVLFHPRNWRS